MFIKLYPKYYELHLADNVSVFHSLSIMSIGIIGNDVMDDVSTGSFPLYSLSSPDSTDYLQACVYDRHYCDDPVLSHSLSDTFEATIPCMPFGASLASHGSLVWLNDLPTGA